MRDYYGSLGFSCVLMGLLAFLVLTASTDAAAQPKIEQVEPGPARERIEVEVRAATSTPPGTGVASATALDLPGTESWTEEARLVAARVAGKYGAPDETTSEALVWRRREPFKRILVRRDAVSHAFPERHTDYLEQTISYRVPTKSFGELAEFDGGLLADRGRGELTARSDREEANILALNLADEVVRGKRTPSQAREFAQKTLAAAAAGKTSAYTQGLLFPLTRVGASDEEEYELGPEPPQKK